MFPATQLPVRVYLAPGAAPASPASWVWEDITSDVLVRAGIVIEQGRPDEATDVDPGQCRLTLRNTAGKYSPRNPASEYYGQLGLNTPLRVTIETLADTFARTATDSWGAADSGQTWTLYGTAADYDVAGGAATMVMSTAADYRYGYIPAHRFADGDILMSWSWSPASVTGAPIAAAVLLRGSSAGDLLCFVYVATTGVMSAVVYDRQGVLIDSATVTPTYAQNQVYWMRVQASGEHVRMRVWEDGDPEPTSWGLQTQVYDLMPGYVAVGGYRFGGNTNNGYVQSIHSVSVEAERFCGFVTAWPPRWDMSRGDEHTPIVAAGVLRRLGQGTGTAASALRRHYRHELAPTAHWPLEEGSSAVRAEPAVTPGRPMAAGGTVTFGGDAPAGSAAAAALAAGDSLIGEVSGVATTAAWTVAWCVARDSDSAAGSLVVTWDTPGGSSGAIKWRATMSMTGGTLVVARVDDTNTATTVATLSSLDWSGWSVVAVTCEESGADLDVSVSIERADTSGDGTSTSGTAAGQGTDAVTRVVVSTSGAGTSPCGLICHVAAMATVLDAAGFAALVRAAAGWDEQLAIDRVEALCGQEGIQVSVPTSDAGTTWLGPQRAESVLSLLREAERSALGLLYERGPGLAYLPRETRQSPSQPWPDVAGPLSVSFDDLADPPEPTDDDQRLRNSWTVSQRDGGQATVTDQASVDAVGLYDDSATVNVAYVGELRHQAGWRVHAGTIDDMRWPRVSFDLARATGLWDVWPGVAVGDRLVLTDPPDGLPPDDVAQVIEGWTERLGPYTWLVELSASPAAPWDAHEYGDVAAAQARYTTAGSTLASAATSSATSLSVATATGPLWTTTDTPFDIAVGGERITVTAVSGAASPQTFTVTRSINGVFKAHDTGAAVELWTPTRYVY